MAINLASKYADKVAERFTKSSLTANAFSNEYQFNGVKGVTVYSVDTAPLGDYVRNGTARYGTPNDLGDSVQELTMSEDKAFTYTIDNGDDSDQMNVKSAAKSLRRQIDEVISPYMDKYRFDVWCRHAGTVEARTAPTAETIVDDIMAAASTLDNALVPETDRTLFLPTEYYRMLKQSPEFVSVDRLGERALSKGVVGEIDGMRVVKVPSGWLPAGVHMLITHKSAVLAPAKLQEYKIHTDPPGINGNLVEGRLLHDAFVLGSRAAGVYCAANSSSVTAQPTIADRKANFAFWASTTTPGATLYYTSDGSDPRYSATAQPMTAEVSYEDWEAGTVFAVYASAPSMFPSGVATQVYEG